MRIAYLLPDPGIPVGGVKGASVHVAEVCRALRASGSTVLLVAMRVVGEPPDGVACAHLDPGPLSRGPEGEVARIAAAEDFFARAEPLVADFRPDLVYERLSLFAGDGGALAARLGVPRLLEVNAPVARERARHFGLARRDAADALERRALAGASIVAVSEPMADWATARGAVAAAVVPNGADVERFAPERAATAAAAVRRGLGLDGAQVIGFAGSLKPWHGVEVLLEAVARLAAERPRVRLLVVGDGPMRSRLEEWADDRLPGQAHFTGAVPNGDMPAYVGAFDIATAPYLPADDFYFSPLKVVEAMAAGRPVVASRFPSVAAMLGGNGSLVTPGDPDELAAALADLLDHPDRARALGAAAQQRARRRYSWSAVAGRILDLARGLPAAPRHPLPPRDPAGLTERRVGG
ncbi:MAG TPA: glycosyltransferase family 4 protein [Thermomicrobiaceae bacterium]|nr:glycosyltransferase family 4 protein [Thermomicrobiaceae bacterium]